MPEVVLFADTHIVEPPLQVIHVETLGCEAIDSLHLLVHEVVVGDAHHLCHLVLHLGLNDDVLFVLNLLWVWPNST